MNLETPVLYGSAHAELNPSVLRGERHPLIGVSDYMLDDPTKNQETLHTYYEQLHNELGINAIRTEFRMKDLIDDETQQSSETRFRQNVHDRYVVGLKSMSEAGIQPVIYLFNSAPWMYELAHTDASRFMNIYTDYVHEVLDIFHESGVTPKYLQVMSEVNWKAQTPLPLRQTIEMIKQTSEITKHSDQPKAVQDIKIMTTFSINSLPFADAPRSSFDDVIEPILVRSFPSFTHWQEDINTVVNECGDALDCVGVDFYPGSYDKQSYSLSRASLANSRPYAVFGNVTPYQWLFEQKLNGVLKEKELLIAETGVFSYNPESRHGQLGIARILQSLDGLLLSYQKRGVSADELLKGVFAFAAADNDAIYTMFPGKIDWKPWTLLRPDHLGEIQPTSIAKTLRYMLGRYFPSVVSPAERPNTHKI